MEGGERGEMDRVVGVDGEGLLGEGVQAEVYCLGGVMLALEGGREMVTEQRTPFTIRVPTRVTCPLTTSFLGVLSTRVLPGSIGASRA